MLGFNVNTICEDGDQGHGAVSDVSLDKTQ